MTTEIRRPIFQLGDFIQEKSVAHSEPAEGSESVFFFNVSRQNEDESDRERFLELIQNAEQGEFQNLSTDELAQGPSYITLGGWLGSQQVALQFIGLLKLLEIGNIVTPSILGVEGEKAQQMAGMGFVMGCLSKDAFSSAS